MYSDPIHQSNAHSVGIIYVVLSDMGGGGGGESNITYRIAGIFQRVKFSWFSWLRGEPRNFYPQNSTA